MMNVNRAKERETQKEELTYSPKCRGSLRIQAPRAKAATSQAFGRMVASYDALKYLLLRTDAPLQRSVNELVVMERDY